MTTTTPQLVSLEPVVLTANRISLNLTTIFPVRSNVTLLGPELDETPPWSRSEEQSLDLEEAIRKTPYPNVEMAILDEEQREVASVFVVEHREPDLSLTLHIRQPQPGKTYIARADLIYQQVLIQTMTASFILPVMPTNGDDR